MGQEGLWLGYTRYMTASTLTHLSVGEEGTNEKPLQCHGGSAPPCAELLHAAGGHHCLWASAEKGMIKITCQTTGNPQQMQPTLVARGTSILDSKGQVAFANSFFLAMGCKNLGLITLRTIFQATSFEKNMGIEVELSKYATT